MVINSNNLCFQWQRACAVRRRVRLLLGEKDSFHGDKVWHTKQLMLWCRANSYTPLDTGQSHIQTYYINLPRYTNRGNGIILQRKKQ